MHSAKIKSGNFFIRVVPEGEKYSLVNKVKPNIIYNRFDILEYAGFNLLEIKNEFESKYICFAIKEETCVLGLYMVDVSKDELNEVMSYLQENFDVDKFSFAQALVKYPKLKQTMHSRLDLPNTYDEFMQQFSSKSRYNRRKELQKLEADFKCEFKHLKKDEISIDLIKKFIKLKSQKKGMSYLLQTLGIYLQVTDVFVLYLNGEMVAISLYSIMDNSNDASCFNIAYDLRYENYSIGSIVFNYSIKKLIEENIRAIYMGGGDYSYKKNMHCVQDITYVGCFSPPPKNFVHRFCRITKKRVRFNIFGIKISIKRGK